MTRPGLPRAGAVLGVDVGYSPSRASSAACRLDWDDDVFGWTVQRFRATPDERRRVLRAVAGAGRLEAAAFDGPLSRGLDRIGAYRAGERMLTRRLWRTIGKPGASNVPVGMALNDAANACARTVLADCDVAASRHATPIDARAVVEAFPSSFMGMMLDDPAAVPNMRANRSDVFYRHLDGSGGFTELLRHLLPGRRPAQAWSSLTNRDDRMALVCAFAALAVVAHDYTAVGDDVHGWIVLPPRRLIRDWALRDLETNAAAESQGRLFFSTPPPSAR